jgi:hypothetical protein
MVRDMRIDQAAIIEDLLDTLITGELAESRPSIAITRLTPGSVRLDCGGASEVFILTVEHEDPA